MTIELPRRGFLTGVGAVGAAAMVTAGGLAACDDKSASAVTGTVAFGGTHQAGIGTPAQDRVAFAAFDLTTDRRTDLVAMLRLWTDAAAAMTLGHPVPGETGALDAPPADTGEAVGLAPASLTITVGFGPSMFDHRYGLASSRPAALADLPALPGDELQPQRTGGDLAVQCCSDDPQVAFHAMRNLARLGRGTAVMRWSQLGFGRTSTTSSKQSTPRNLMGFKDGTRNVKGDDAATMDEHVWVGHETDQDWMLGGSYLVARRIRMLVEAWDRDYLGDQQNVFGRFKQSGAPLTGTKETDSPDYDAESGGEPVIPADAHIRLASPENNDGLRILRRGYSYTDGVDPVTGQLDAGLFFLAYQKDPRTQFVALQRKLGLHDALNEYIKHTGSGVFACPPGVTSGQYWGQSLFA